MIRHISLLVRVTQANKSQNVILLAPLLHQTVHCLYFRPSLIHCHYENNKANKPISKIN